MKPNISIAALVCGLIFSVNASAKTIESVSPDGRNKIGYSDKNITVTRDGNALLSIPVDIVISQNGRTIPFGKGINIEVRAFDDGVAYRYVSKLKGDYIVESEKADFTFPGDYTSYLPHSTNRQKPEAMAFQATFDVAPISRQGSLLAFLPATVDCGSAKVTLLESDLDSYPGMFISAEGTTLKASFAKYPRTMEYYNWRHMTYVKDTENYLARCKGPRTFPWRVLSIAEKDTDMPSIDIVSRLAEPSRIADTSWIRPGRVAWDWWNDWGLQGVPFKAGINTQTYKYYIDFASRNHLEYIILDEGWYEPKSGDIMNPIPDINLPELISYGKQKNVGIILWCVFNVLDEHLQDACEKYSSMGIKGFKVDFMDRNDQTAVEMTYRIADMCARHHLVLDYHGIYSPAGLNTTYPNVLNFEAVFGMEEVKWTTRSRDNSEPSKDMPLYDVTFPFIRGQAGPVDFTPGGMRNATKADFQPVNNNPMTMGTRCHQMAHYIVHDSPLTMFADSPSAYEREPECTSFLASLPSSYNSLRCIDGKMGEYIVVLRSDKNGNYYVGGETNWDSRDIALDFSFLPENVTFKATMFYDGPNADHVATDWQQTSFTATRATKLPQIHLSSAGGFAIKLEKQK